MGPSRPSTGRCPPGQRSTVDDARRRRGGCPRRASRHLQAVRRDAGARRRRTRAAARRGPCARRRERGRQEHPRQDPRRRPSTGFRLDLARRGRDRHPRPRAGARARDRGGPPGAAALPRPERRRERVHRACPVWPAGQRRLAGDAPRRQGPLRGARGPVRRHGAGARPLDGRPAAHRDRKGPLGRGACAHPRRAHSLALRARSRAPLRHRPPPAGSRRGRALREPPARRGLRPVRPDDGLPRWPARHHDRDAAP